MALILPTPQEELNWLQLLLHSHIIHTHYHGQPQLTSLTSKANPVPRGAQTSSTRKSHLFYKVKSRAGIAGNKCVDKIAKYQASPKCNNLTNTGIPNAGSGGNPFYNIAWLAREEARPRTSESSPITNLILVCPLPECLHMDSALHILSGCQCHVIRNMAAHTVWLSMTCTSLCKFLIVRYLHTSFNSAFLTKLDAPKAALMLSCRRRYEEVKSSTTPAGQLHELDIQNRHIHEIEIKYCEDTRSGAKLEASQQQHSELCKQLQGAEISLHIILL
eukprot:1140236-Pelagomonas_calceolata.AAC.1